MICSRFAGVSVKPAASAASSLRRSASISPLRLRAPMHAACSAGVHAASLPCSRRYPGPRLLVRAGRDAAMLDVCDRIRAGVKVRGNVRGEEDRHALLLAERPERVQQLVTRDGVKAGRRLVEDQQLRPVRHGGRQLILDLHALRQLADALALVERKLPDEARVAPSSPPGIKALRDVRQLAQALLRW